MCTSIGRRSSISLIGSYRAFGRVVRHTTFRSVALQSTRRWEVLRKDIFAFAANT